MAHTADPLFRTVRVSRASEDIVLQIRENIFSGKLAPGDRLPSEKELAEQFGLSRITVRDALRILESQNLIFIKVGAGGGAFVAHPNPNMLTDTLTDMLRLQGTTPRELSEARLPIEMTIVRLAAERATEEDLEALHQAVSEARAGRAAGDPHFTSHSVDFHIALAKAAKNQVLFFTVNSFRTLFYETLEQLVPDDEMSLRAIDDHQKILDAIIGHEGERAAAVMGEHLEYFERRTLKLHRAQKKAG